MEYGCHSMVGKLQTVLLKHPKDTFVSQHHLERHWKSYGYLSCPDYEEALREYEQFERLLRQEVPDLHFLSFDENTGLDSIYAHDAFKMTGKGAIILRPGKSLRQKEADAVKKLFTANGIPILGEITGEGRVEGGDLVWLDERTLAVARGFRTNDEGIRQLKEITAGLVDEIIIVPLPYHKGPEECLHLMSVISMVDDDLAAVYSPLMPIFFRELLIDKGIRLIEVPEDEYDRLGCNVLALAPRTCMVMSGNGETKRRLEDAGARVIEYKGDEISYKGTGGPTCLTGPISRS